MSHFVIVFIVVLALGACGDGTPVGPRFPTPTEIVLEFIESENLPLLRWSEQYFVFEDVEAFNVDYGHPMDCESGCAYRSAYGLRLKTKCGWLRVFDGEGFEPDSASYFEITASDSAIFQPALWESIGADYPQAHWLWAGLLPCLAGDPDTPLDSQLFLSQMLYSFISPHVAWRQLENPSVQADKAILTVLAALPVFQGDAYRTARARAQELLDAIDKLAVQWSP